MNKIIGVTGKMSSGKTTLCQKIMNKTNKYLYIDFDVYRRNLLKNDVSYQNLLLKQIKNLNDINCLNEIIYSNKNSMKIYKKILYKYFFKYLGTLNDDVIVEWALIVEDNLYKKFDKLIIIDVNDEELFKRLECGDLGRENIKKRLNMQYTTEKKKKTIKNFHYFIVDNNAHFSDVLAYMEGKI